MILELIISLATMDTQQESYRFHAEDRPSMDDTTSKAREAIEERNWEADLSKESRL